MGETAAETRAEIAQLRDDMTGHIVALRTAAQRGARVARLVALATGGVALAGVALVIAMKVRARSEAQTPKGRLIALKNAPRRAREQAERQRQKLRQDLRKQFAKELQDARPLHEKILTDMAQKAAGAATPIAIKKLEQLTHRAS